MKHRRVLEQGLVQNKFAVAKPRAIGLPTGFANVCCNTFTERAAVSGRSSPTPPPPPSDLRDCSFFGGKLSTLVSESRVMWVDSESESESRVAKVESESRVSSKNQKKNLYKV